MRGRPQAPSYDPLVGYDTDGIPLLIAEERGDLLRTWCMHCRRWHTHGEGFGHRTAHCYVDASPFRRTGYYLVPADPSERQQWLREYRIDLRPLRMVGA